MDTVKPKNTKLCVISVFYPLCDYLLTFSRPIVVQKENPYTFDLGHLLAQDPNPLVIPRSENVNESLKAVARDGAQSLLNQLLVCFASCFRERQTNRQMLQTTCPVTSNAKDGVLMTLPPPNTLLPRYKPLCATSFPLLHDIG